jgi:hypothetical protein
MSQAQATATAQLADFEARAREDGVLNQDGFFTQDDWEFELDTLQDRSREALEAHLRKGADHDTAMFLKGYLMDSRAHFTPFSDD